MPTLAEVIAERKRREEEKRLGLWSKAPIEGQQVEQPQTLQDMQLAQPRVNQGLPSNEVPISEQEKKDIVKNVYKKTFQPIEEKIQLSKMPDIEVAPLSEYAWSAPLETRLNPQFNTEPADVTGTTAIPQNAEPIKPSVEVLNTIGLADKVSDIKRKANMASIDEEVTRLQDDFDMMVNGQDNALAVGAKGYYHGVGDLLSSVATGVRFVGGVFNNKDMQRWGDEYYDRFQEELKRTRVKRYDLMSFEKSDLIKPIFYIYNVGRVLPGMQVAQFAGELGEISALSALSKVKNIQPSNILKLARFAGAFQGGAVGAFQESMPAYRTILELGGSEKDAALGATIYGGMSWALNSLSLLSWLDARATNFPIAKMSIASANEAITEMLEIPAENETRIALGVQTAADAYKGVWEELAVIGLTSLAASFLNQGAEGIINYKAYTDAQKKAKEDLIDFLAQNSVNPITGELVNPFLEESKPYTPHDKIEDVRVEQPKKEPKVETLERKQVDWNSPEAKAHREEIKRWVNERYAPVDRFGVKAASWIDNFAFQYSTTLSAEEKARITRNVMESINTVYALNKNSKVLFDTIKDNVKRDEIEAFTKWAELPNEKNAPKTEEQRARWQRAYDMTMQFDGENKSKIDSVIEDNISVAEEIQGRKFTTTERETYRMKHLIGVSFPNNMTIEANANKIKQLKGLRESTLQKGEDVTAIDAQIKFYERNMQVLIDNKGQMRYFPMSIRQSVKLESIKGKPNLIKGQYAVLDEHGFAVKRFTERQDAITYMNEHADEEQLILESKTRIGNKIKTERYALKDIENIARGRLTTWEMFYDLPEEVRAKYYQKPEELALEHMTTAGYRYTAVKLLNNMMKTEGVFAPATTEDKNFTKIPDEIVNVYPELEGMKMNSMFVNMMSQALMANKQGITGKVAEAAGKLSFINNLFVNWLIANPGVMIIKNMEQASMIDPLSGIWIVPTFQAFVNDPVKYQDMLQFGIDVGLVTGDNQTSPSLKMDVEQNIDYIEELEDKNTQAVRRLLTYLIDPKTRNKNMIVQVISGVSGISRKMAFDIGDTTFKVGIAQMIRSRAEKAVDNAKEYGKLVYPDDRTEFVRVGEPLSEREIKIRRWTKAYIEKYQIAEIIGNYGRIAGDTKTIVNWTASFWQLRVSQISYVMRYAQLAAGGDPEAIRRIGVWFFMWWLDNYIAGALGFSKQEKYYRSTKGITRDAESIYSLLGMNAELESVEESFTKQESAMRNWFEGAVDKSWIEKIHPQTLGYKSFGHGSRKSYIVYDKNGKIIKTFESNEEAENFILRNVSQEYSLNVVWDDKTGIETANDYNEDMQKQEDVIIGARLATVSSSPVRLIDKILGKGIGAILPAESPIAWLAEAFMNEDIGFWEDGDYRLLADKNSSVAQKAGAIVQDFVHEKIGLKQLYEQAMALTKNNTGVSKTMAWLAILGNKQFTYKKNGKTYQQLRTAKDKLLDMTLANEARLFDSNGKKREIQEQQVVAAIAQCWILRDKTDGIDDPKWLDVTKRTLKEEGWWSNKNDYQVVDSKGKVLDVVATKEEADMIALKNLDKGVEVKTISNSFDKEWEYIISSLSNAPKFNSYLNKTAMLNNYVWGRDDVKGKENFRNYFMKWYKINSRVVKYRTDRYDEQWIIDEADKEWDRLKRREPN